jgi:hypothetical protein
MAIRLRLGELFAVGGRSVTRYTGTLLAVFVVQSVVVTAAMLAIAAVLAQVFSHLPMWDDAVDGDLVSLIACMRLAKANLMACAGIGLSALLLWQLAAWFLVGGIYGVLSQKPEGRGDTARCFGASGAATYLAYARLALCALPGWAFVLFVFAACTGAVATRIEHALVVTDLIAPLAVALVPALVVLHVLWTIVDYARVELSLRHESHDPGVVATYVRTAAFVLRRPITLVHGGVGWLAFAVVTLGYAYLAHGHPMYGAEGAVTLFVIRQGVALGRTAIRFGVLAGQIEAGRTRALPPRRVDAKVETAKKA